MAADSPQTDSSNVTLRDEDDAALVLDLREAFGLRPDGSHAGAGSGPECPTVSQFQGVLAAGAEPPVEGRLADFEILGELGRGGMGVVYRARQISLGREVALKVLPGYARQMRAAAERFRRESLAAARLHHTNIVAIYGQGEDRGYAYYAMELVDGVGLDAVIRDCPEAVTRAGRVPSHGSAHAPPAAQPPADAAQVAGSSAVSRSTVTTRSLWRQADYRRIAELFAEVADALAFAHRQGVIHRDVKPHNLLLGQDRRLHLTDFGLALLAGEPHLTVSGEVMGTPAYLSPEQVRGGVGRIDHRTDIYSLGATLYELLTGRKPFEGQTREQLLTSITTVEPPPPRRLDHRIPPELDTICMRALQKDPAHRHPSADVLAEDLRRFAQGRPILSRRATPVEKAMKWVRRHKAVSTAGVATALVVLLGTMLVIGAVQRRHEEADRLLRDAYEQLAYVDYRRPERVQSQIDRAAALEAGRDELDLVRALAGIGANDVQQSLSLLEALAAKRPDDPRVLCMLAWAHRRTGDVALARVLVARVERLAAAPPADAWFYRGLAMHFDDPADAIASYQRAIAARAKLDAFYPQAVLHLARAHNQQLYAARQIEHFPAAEESLRQLAEHGYYGAYPHYLLSIAHRLAAEIYRGSSGTRDDSSVRDHYAQSLAWARSGQERDPADDRPVTAEAECLESMGLLADAIDARTRAIELARSDEARCEGYHYRWRLNYWTGNFQAALEDVQVHAACEPESWHYAHVYPALILAETGNIDAAAAHAHALAQGSPRSAQRVLWSVAVLRLLGMAHEADALLDRYSGLVDFGADLVLPQTEEWVAALYVAARGEASIEALEALSGLAETPWRLWGEACFHVGVLRLASGDRAGASELLERAYRAFDGEQGYTYHARILCERLRRDPDWPPWFGADGGER